ncbi:hypothetical protein C8P63_11151 [Melghirimyces profundicolus]|uniref:Uncharacterized protein n=1 Tax=Melghirimyces profundicolus TaxID=1242148 RepID=A0A2T6BUA6_9BACL|nr:hypothetical protein [Melghirimyces profundicolus]PTX59616.1 hypothetical protein C8P63_11151 [Melghirimyces profundicolus]
MRTAALTLMLFVLALITAPAAFAESSRENAASSMNAVYYTKGDKHVVEVALPEATHPQGTWVLTLNGSQEQSSPESAGAKKFTAEYEDLVPGRNYQLIAVFYGKDGSRSIDLDGCFQFQPAETQSDSNKVPLKDCGFAEVVNKLKKSGETAGKAASGEDDAVLPSADEGKGNAENPEKSTKKAPEQEEESGTLENLNSGQKEKGGPMPDTSADTFPAALGLHLILLGFALFGFQRSPIIGK